MVTIRQGKMRDCTDILTIYQTTCRYYRTRQDGFKTVEEVKSEHRGVGFKNWGWLVAEIDGIVVGEIIFHIEKNPIVGRIGIIRNIDIDVRQQKKKIGTQLIRATEKILKERGAARIVLKTPPEAYNFWMKVEYFARGALLTIKTNPDKFKSVNASGVKAVRLKDVDRLPKSMEFSNIATPGLLVNRVRNIVDEGKRGQLFEYFLKGNLVGVGVVIKTTPSTAEFVVDTTLNGKDHLGYIISKTASTAKTWNVKGVTTIIPKDQLDNYKSVARWSVEDFQEIPVTRII
ncbi:MAG: GNAT family N-acetyltransferase [Candidatus Thorarchaeota archaeon]